MESLAKRIEGLEGGSSGQAALKRERELLQR